MGTVTPKQSLIINPNSDLDHFGMTIGEDLNLLRTMHGSASFQIGDDPVVVIAGGSTEDASNTCEILNEDGWMEGTYDNSLHVKLLLNTDHNCEFKSKRTRTYGQMPIW